MLKKLIITVLLIAPLFGVEIVINKSSEPIEISTFTRDNIKEVVNDSATGLMWQDDASVKSVKKSWREAKEYCENLTKSGYSDWFLPSIAELESIVDTKRYNPAIKKEFQNSVSSFYWSSSPVSYSNSAWYVDFKSGYSYRNRKTNSGYVRCARAGQ